MHMLDNMLPSIGQFHLLGYWVAFLSALLETTLVAGLLPGIWNLRASCGLQLLAPFLVTISISGWAGTTTIIR